jgi:anti-sigma factor (TIGR02949 family)
VSQWLARLWRLLTGGRGSPGRADATPPGGIDCEAVLDRLYEYIDDELHDPDTIRRIRTHLELCSRCYPQYRFEEAFLRFLAAQGRSDAPPGLRRRVFERILEEERRT